MFKYYYNTNTLIKSQLVKKKFFIQLLASGHLVCAMYLTLELITILKCKLLEDCGVIIQLAGFNYQDILCVPPRRVREDFRM